MHSDDNQKFCGTWACSQYETESFNMPPVSLENNILRQIVKVTVGGKVIRVKFSNLCGESELELKSVKIAESLGKDEILSETEKKLYFCKNESVIIHSGEEIYSDSMDFNLKPLTEYAVTICYGKVPSRLTGHPGSRTTSYIEESVTKNKFSAEHWYTLSAIDVLNDRNLKSAVCFGDSITDGRGSTTNLQNRWTDVFARYLQDNGKYNVSVINQGIGGTCVTQSGVFRFDRDVLNQPGISYLILLYGINDIIYADCDAEKIIATYKDFIFKAHKKNIRVFGGTILPFGKCRDWNPEREAVRLKVNEWIRNSSSKNDCSDFSDGFDGFIDFAAHVKNGDLEELPESNENDGLHPTAKLYDVMGKLPPLHFFD